MTRTVDRDSEKDIKPSRAHYKVKLVGYKSRKRSAQKLSLMQSLESSVVNKSINDAQNSMKDTGKQPKTKSLASNNLLNLGRK